MLRRSPKLFVALLMPLAAQAGLAAEMPPTPPAPLPPEPRAAAPLMPVPAAVPVPRATVPVPGSIAPNAPYTAHGEGYLPRVAVPAGMPPVQPGYPYLNAPLYPSPQPNVPVQVGSTLITNQALYPQEMLYPHDYEALYPPFYHRVKGTWIRTPFGTKSDERWELLGTKVTVKYRSSIPLWTGFHVPNRDFFDYDENWANPSGTHNEYWHSTH